MKTKEISVVMATFNGEKFLRQQLDSIFFQTYPIMEVVIVDDASTDGTVEIIREYCQKHNNIKFVINDYNKNVITSFQYAASLASGEYFAFCDQDDIWHKDKLLHQIEILESNNIDEKKPLLLFHDLTVTNNDNKVLSDSYWDLMKFKKYNFDFENLLYKNIVTGCTCLINKEMKDLFIKVNPTKLMMHDHWFALVGFGIGQVFFSKEKLIYYRSHSTTVTPKDKITILSKFKNLLYDENKCRSEYFSKHFLQAIEFKNHFENILSSDYKMFLNKMINRKEKKFIVKVFRMNLRVKNLFYK